MTQPLIALTPASGPGVGGGHVVRCLALAMALEACGARCVFVAGAEGAEILKRFGGDFETVLAEGDGRLAALNGLGAQSVVIDDYTLDAAFEVRLTAPIVMAVDDLADRPHTANLLLDPGYGRTPEDYAGWTPLETHLLLGPDYALLKPGFEATTPDSPEVVRRLFLSFGLSDVAGIAGRAAALIVEQVPTLEVDAAVSSSAESLPALRTLAARHPSLRLHLDAETAPLMRAADAAVGAGGAMTWERRALGLPSLAVIVADNQRPMIRRLAEDGVLLAVDLGEPDFDRRFGDAFARLLDPVVRRAMIANPLAACDGRGAGRAAEALLAMLQDPLQAGA